MSARENVPEAAWVWLSGVVLGNEERRYCLERVIEINPEHTAARRALPGLSSEGAKPAAPSQSSDERSFREKSPASYRTADGHMVRSRAEVVHADADVQLQ